MAKKTKNQDKPKKVNIYFDRLSIQMGFMNYDMCGYLLKMIVYYSMGQQEEVEKVKEDLMNQYPDLSGMVLMAFAENKVAIDEDLKAYAEVCEKRRELALVREANKREQRESNDHNCAQVTTNDHNCAQVTTKSTNTNTITNTNTKTSNDVVKEEKEETVNTDNILLSDVEKAKRLVKEMLEADVWKESVCMKFSKKVEDIDSRIREFGVHIQAMDNVPVDLTDAKRYFVSWLRIQEQEVKKTGRIIVDAASAEDERKAKSEELHRQYNEDKANARPMPETLKKRFGLA